MVHERISILAAAHSIYVSAQRIFPHEISRLLVPKLLPRGEISLGETLIFKDHQFINILVKGFGLPKLLSVFYSPYWSCKALLYLWRVGKLYSAKNSNHSTEILLHASLTAICTYMNLHEKSVRIFENEKNNSLSVGILGTGNNYVISNHKGKGWSAKLEEKPFSTSACLFFNNFDTARNASLGKIDSWNALAKGHIQLSGRIPLLEKFGYVARIVQKEVPTPK